MGISCAVLIGIFLFQRLGTAKIGFSYAPILLLWFTCNAAVGCYNIATCYPAIFRVSSSAVTPYLGLWCQMLPHYLASVLASCYNTATCCIAHFQGERAPHEA